MQEPKTSLENLCSILENSEVIVSGHFKLSSGAHSDTYINKDMIYSLPLLINKIAENIATEFRGKHIDVVAGPAVGGAIFSASVASILCNYDFNFTRVVYLDKDVDRHVLRRGYSQLVFSKRVLVLDDITSTGTTLKNVIKVIRFYGGYVADAAVICNRGTLSKLSFDRIHNFYALLNRTFNTWSDKQSCELCKRGVPLNVDLGHGVEDIVEKAQEYKSGKMKL